MRFRIDSAVSRRPSIERSYVETTDLDEVCALASAAQHPIRADLLGPCRPLHYTLAHRACRPLSLSRVRFDYGGRYVVEAPPIRTHYHLQLPLGGGARVRHGAVEVDTAPGVRGLIVSPEEETRWRGAGSFEELTVNLDRDRVERAWEQLTGRTVRGCLRFAPGLALGGDAAVMIRTLARWCWDAAHEPPSTAGGVEDALLGWLLSRAPHDHVGRVCRRGVLEEERRVQRAEAWFLSHATRRSSVRMAAAIQGVTVRTLQRAFERRRAYTPREFMRRARFERARQFLREAGAHERVTDVALSLGFEHLGQFSIDYRQRFGESPSATLRRAR